MKPIFNKKFNVTAKFYKAAKKTFEEEEQKKGR